MSLQELYSFWGRRSRQHIRYAFFPHLTNLTFAAPGEYINSLVRKKTGREREASEGMAGVAGM